jgi:Tfp pilus assembly protein PilZ
MEKRRQARVAKNLLGKLYTKTSDFLVYVHDLAKNGLGFTCNRDLTVGDEVRIALNVPGYATMTLEGRLSWHRSLPVVAKARHQYGLVVAKPTAEYLTLLDTMLRRDYERRRDPRFTDVLVVESDDILDLLDAATSNVSAGGLYICTNVELEMARQYELKLSGVQLTEPILCLVEVVAVFDTNIDELTHPFGAGVKFVSFAGDGEKRFIDYIRSLEDLYRYHWPKETVN